MRSGDASLVNNAKGVLTFLSSQSDEPAREFLPAVWDEQHIRDTATTQEACTLMWVMERQIRRLSDFAYDDALLNEQRDIVEGVFDLVGLLGRVHGGFSHEDWARVVTATANKIQEDLVAGDDL